MRVVFANVEPSFNHNAFHIVPQSNRCHASIIVPRAVKLLSFHSSYETTTMLASVLGNNIASSPTEPSAIMTKCATITLMEDVLVWPLHRRHCDFVMVFAEEDGEGVWKGSPHASPRLLLRDPLRLVCALALREGSAVGGGGCLRGRGLRPLLRWLSLPLLSDSCVPPSHLLQMRSCRWTLLVRGAAPSFPFKTTLCRLPSFPWPPLRRPTLRLNSVGVSYSDQK